MENPHVLAHPAEVVTACRVRRPGLAREIAAIDPLEVADIEEGRIRMRMLDALERRCDGAPAQVALSPDEQRLLDWPGKAAGRSSAARLSAR